MLAQQLEGRELGNWRYFDLLIAQGENIPSNPYPAGHKRNTHKSCNGSYICCIEMREPFIHQERKRDRTLLHQTKDRNKHPLGE